MKTKTWFSLAISNKRVQKVHTNSMEGKHQHKDENILFLVLALAFLSVCVCPCVVSESQDLRYDRYHSQLTIV